MGENLLRRAVLCLALMTSGLARSASAQQPDELPDLGSGPVRCLSNWHTDPAVAFEGAPVTLIVWGWFPYRCGQVADAAVLGPEHVTLSLKPGPACDDTVRTWSHAFPLDMMTPGEHRIRVDLVVHEDPRDTTLTRTAVLPMSIVRAPPTVVPNPFVDATSFSVVGTGGEHLQVEIFDVRGRRVASVFDGPMAGGRQVVPWDCRLDDGSRAPEGVYFSRVALAGRVVTRRLVRLPR